MALPEKGRWVHNYRVNAHPLKRGVSRLRRRVWALAWLLGLGATWLVGFFAGQLAHTLEQTTHRMRWLAVFAVSAAFGALFASQRRRWRRRYYRASTASSRLGHAATDVTSAQTLSALGGQHLTLDARWESLMQATHALLGILCQTLPHSRTALVSLEGPPEHPSLKRFVCRPKDHRPEPYAQALARVAERTASTPCVPVALDVTALGPQAAMAMAVWAESRPAVADTQGLFAQRWIHLIVDRPHGPPFTPSECQLAQSLVEQLALSHQLEVALKTSQADLGRLAHLATTDGLTELANRRHFMGVFDLQLARARRHARPLSLLFLDIDHFKAVNDTFGHGVGDEVLRDLAQLLTDTARCTDLVARYGGEEFAILMDETSLTGGGKMAERIRQALRRKPLGQSVALEKTCSIGVASFPEHGHDAATLIAAADQALYEAKNRGRDQIVLFNSDPSIARHGERSMG